MNSVLYYNKDLCTPVNSVCYFLFRSLIALAFLSGLAAILLVPVNLIRALFRKKARTAMTRTLLSALPHLLILALLWLMASLVPLHALANAGSINGQTLGIFFITLLLPLICLFNGYLLFRQWRMITGKVTRYYYSVVWAGSSLLTIFLASHGFFALALWNY